MYVNKNKQGYKREFYRYHQIEIQNKEETIYIK